jgi:hypothetical protein
MGEPYAGNLQVQFDEGGGVTAAPTLLVKIPSEFFNFACVSELRNHYMDRSYVWVKVSTKGGCGTFS